MSRRLPHRRVEDRLAVVRVELGVGHHRLLATAGAGRDAVDGGLRPRPPWRAPVRTPSDRSSSRRSCGRLRERRDRRAGERAPRRAPRAATSTGRSRVVTTGSGGSP